MTKLNILVGTMYCGEGEFWDSRDSLSMLPPLFPDILGDTKVTYDHVVISHKPEVPAHYQLYQKFKNGPYDYLFKVDADMVVQPGALGDLLNAMKAPGVDAAVGRVRDYFTRADIWGLWLYSQRVNWDWGNFTEQCVQPDLFDRGRVGHIHDHLATHCERPTPIQSFHYGYHRVVQRKNQQTHLRCLLDHFALTRAPRLYYACLGALTSLDHVAAGTNEIKLDYGAKLDAAFAEALGRKLSDKDLAYYLNARLLEHLS